MTENVTRLLWTGGWDSTFRLLDLVLIKKKVVKPYYIIDPDRRSTGIEIRTMRDIKKILFEKHCETRGLLLSTEFHDIFDIKANELITQQYEIFRDRVALGSQYEWLSRFADEYGISDLEICVEFGTGRLPQVLKNNVTKSSQGNDSFYRVKNDDPNTPEYRLLKYFRFPVYHLTKLDMKKIAIEHGFYNIMEMTWFCHHPRKNGIPCGTCNPCIQTAKDGLGWRIPFTSRMRYYTRKALHLDKLEVLIRNQPILYHCTKYPFRWVKFIKGKL